MHSLVLKSIKGHMFASFEYMSAVMFENLLQVLQSQDTHFCAAINKNCSHSQFLYLGWEILIINLLVGLRESFSTAFNSFYKLCLFWRIPVLEFMCTGEA